MTKLVATALSLPGQGTDDTTLIDYGGRLLIDYGVTIPKWRVRIRNFNVNMNVVRTGSLSLVGLTLGEAEFVNGAPSGRYIASSTVALQGAANTDAAGAEWVSDWFTTPLLSHKKYMLGYGFTADAGQMVYRGMGAVWAISTGSVDVANTAKYASRTTLVPLDIWIECEVPDETPVKAIVGDSLSVGHSSTSPAHDSFLAAHCRTEGALPVFWAASGDTLASFADATAPKVVKYDGMARPDVVFVNLGGNDIFGSSTDLATMKTRLTTTLNIVRSKITPNIVLCSILPRLDTLAAAEDVRQAYNDWLATTLPSGAAIYKDVSDALLSSADPRILDTKWTASPTNIHLSTAGYARVAEVL